jgi:hypothetical protein
MHEILKIFALLALLAIASTAGAVELNIIPIPIQSYRLLDMSMDDEGFVWFGSTHQVLHRYGPRTGQVENFPVPYETPAINNCSCVDSKVYILGQVYPRLIVFDRASRTFSEQAYPSPQPNVWYGTELIDNRLLYFFDRQSVGVIRWDTQSNAGKAMPYPYETSRPTSGIHVAADNSLWCRIPNLSQGIYVSHGVARYDLARDEFTGLYPFPTTDADLPRYDEPESTLFFNLPLAGKLVPFDFKRKEWRRSISIPRFGELFAFVGGTSVHKGRHYFSLSTYNGTPTGCDGKPYHFLNVLLEFDPASGEFSFPTLEVKDKYYQISYHFSAGGELFATGSNIRRMDGTLYQANRGDCVVWQSKPLEK